MSSRLLAVLIIFPIWLTLVLVLRKHRQWLLYYLVAAFGLTLQLVFLAEHFGWDQTLVDVASFHVSLMSKYIFHIPAELLTNGRFQLTLPGGSSSILRLGIECSAVLESAIAVGLILFYPLFSFSQKILRALFALVVTYVINILRLMIIVLMAYKFGPDYIFLAHAGVARIFFFACEIALYWYLMTKPTVKSVGVSIEEGIPLGVASSIGHAFQLRYALTQIIIIILVIGAGAGSFMVSHEWQKAFVPVAQVERPIIYPEETGLTPSPTPTPSPSSTYGPAPLVAIEGAATTSFNQEITLDLNGGEKTLQKFDIQNEETLNVQVLEGQKDLAARLMLNGESVELVTLAPWVFNKEKSIFKPLTVKAGDVLEIKFQNTTDTPSQYLIKIFADGMENTPVSIPEPVPSLAEIQPELTSLPVAQAPDSGFNHKIASAKTQVLQYITGLYQGLVGEIPDDILIGKETAAVAVRQLKPVVNRFSNLNREIAKNMINKLETFTEDSRLFMVRLDLAQKVLLGQATVYPTETNLTPPAVPTPQAQVIQPAVAGLTTATLDQETTLDLKGNEKTTLKFDIQQAELLNVQVLSGQEALAARIMLNGQSVELVTLEPWVFNKQTSIFQPLTVQPGDVLEIKFQNLAETPSSYLIKISPNGGQLE